MGTRYVVSVIRVEDDEGSDNRYITRDTVLFEATHTDPVRLARFAPGEVLEALAAGIAVGGAPERAPVPIGDEPDPAALVAPRAPNVGEQAGAAMTAATEAMREALAPKPRKRRTKAEMDAARAATESRLEGAPEQAFGLPAQVAEGVEQHAAAAAAVVADPAPEAPVAPAAPGSAPGAAPFNPFM